MNVKSTDFNQYLLKNYTAGTSKRYARGVRLLLKFLGSKEAVEQASYKDIINYLHTLREQKYSHAHIAAELAEAHVNILGTSPEVIDLAEDRDRFRSIPATWIPAAGQCRRDGVPAGRLSGRRRFRAGVRTDRKSRPGADPSVPGFRRWRRHRPR